MTFRGNLLLYSLWYELHPFENLRRKGHHCHGLTHLSCRTQNFLPVFGKNFVGCSFTPTVSAAGCGCLCPRRQGLIRVCGTRQAMSRGPPQRRRARARNGVALTSRRPFAGMPGAQATARQRRRDRNGRCKPGFSRIGPCGSPKPRQRVRRRLAGAPAAACRSRA